MELQRYPADRYELVLIDDGSTNTEALEYLDELEPRFALRGWTIVRSENMYLGAARNKAVKFTKYALCVISSSLVRTCKPDYFLNEYTCTTVHYNCIGCGGSRSFVQVSQVHANLRFGALCAPPVRPARDRYPKQTFCFIMHVQDAS